MILNFKFPTSSSKNRHAGFTVVEIIIAIALLSFGIVLVYSSFASIVTVTNNVHSRFTAAYLAQEGLEVIRNLRDNNFITKSQTPATAWNLGLTGAPCNTGCMVDYKTKIYTQIVPYSETFLGLNDKGFYSYDGGAVPTIFKRKIIITPVLGLPDAINVAVTIYWDYNGRAYTFDANENLYNWY